MRERNRNDPDNSNNNIGFRVVASHGLWVRPEMSRGDRCGTEARAGEPCLPEERRGLSLAGGSLSTPSGEYIRAPPSVVGFDRLSRAADGRTLGRGTHPASSI